MNLHWIKVGGLWPLNTGGRLRSFHILRELSRAHRVTVLTTHGPKDDPEGLAEALGPDVTVVSVPHTLAKQGTPAFAAALMRSWLSRDPVDLWKCRAPSLRRAAFASLRSATPPDLILADFLAVAPNIPFGEGVPVVLFTHNVEHLIWKRLAERETRPWARAALEIEWRKMRAAEARACRRATLTLAVSDTDRDHLQALAPRAPVRTVPTGVDTDFYSPSTSEPRPDSLVFCGSLDWYPNEDGLMHFIEAVLPRIRAEVPALRVTLVGRNPSHRLRAAAEAAGLVVTGTVDDVRPYVHEAAVNIVPLRVGSGTRLKIFEALSMGKAVVSTTIGAEGLDMHPGIHYVRADSPDEFARATVDLLRNPERRRAIERAGRDLVASRYGWTQVARAFDACLQEARARVPQAGLTCSQPAPLTEECR